MPARMARYMLKSKCRSATKRLLSQENKHVWMDDSVCIDDHAGWVLTVTNPASVSASSASVVLMFGLLFLIGLLTRLVRGKAW